jgi:hypothetical protein
MREKEKCRKKKTNRHARLSSSNMGNCLFAAKLVNNTAVRKVAPMHVMMACGEGEL